jgi:hypothetical protein
MPWLSQNQTDLAIAENRYPKQIQKSNSPVKEYIFPVSLQTQSINIMI